MRAPSRSHGSGTLAAGQVSGGHNLEYDRYLVDQGSNPAEVYARSNVVVVGRSNNVGKPAVLAGAVGSVTLTNRWLSPVTPSDCGGRCEVAGGRPTLD